MNIRKYLIAGLFLPLSALGQQQLNPSQIPEITNSMQANMAANTIKGNDSNFSAAPQNLTTTEARALLNVENGADVTDTSNVTAAGALMDSEVDADIQSLTIGASATVTGSNTGDQAASQVAVSPAGNLTSTDVQGALQELQADVDAGTGTDDQTAAEVAVTPAGNLGSTNVQAALQELQTDIDAGSGTDDQTAAEVPFTATGNTIATDVQGAIVEIQTEVDSLVSGGGGDMLGSNNLSELTNTGTARTNLGLGTAATTAATDYATAAQGATADTALQTEADVEAILVTEAVTVAGTDHMVIRQGSTSGPMKTVAITPGGIEVIDETTTISTDPTSFTFVGTGVTVDDTAVADEVVVTITSGGSESTTVSDTAEIDHTLSGSDISSTIVAGSIDETKLDASTNASLDLADSSVQPADVLGDAQVNGSLEEDEINHDNLVGFVANEHLDWTVDQGATLIDAGNYIDNDTNTQLSNAQVETAYNSQVTQISAGEITAGTETDIRRFSPDDVVSLIGTHGGGGVDDNDYGDITVSGAGLNWNIDANSVALGTDTTGNYAAGDAEAGAALTGDSATAFFSSGTIEAARLPVVTESFTIRVSDLTTAITTGKKEAIRMPYPFNLTDVRGFCDIAPTGAEVIMDVHEAGTSIMTTDKLDIEIDDFTTEDAATQPVLTDTSLADDGLIEVYIDQVGSTVAGAGCGVTLIGNQP